MAGEPIYLNPLTPIRENLSDLPAGFKSFLKRGFATLAWLDSQGKTTEVFSLVLDENNEGGRITRALSKEISARLGIEADDVAPLFTTATFCTTIFIQEEALTPDEFVSALAETGVLDAKNEGPVLPFIDCVARNRAQAAEAVERSQVTTRLLPSLTKFSATIDVRPQFTEDGDSVKYAVPVILARIGTDSGKKDLWLQMSKKQAQRLITDLETALRKVDVAETWATNR